MAADLPQEFDVVVLGTGMPESIVAAAFSRIGQSVLHLDRNEFYSGDWASFSLKAIEKWVEDHKSDADSKKEDRLARPSIDESSLLEDGEQLVQLPLYNSSFSQLECKFLASEEEDVPQEAGSGDGVEKVTADLGKLSTEQDSAAGTTDKLSVDTNESEESANNEATAIVNAKSIDTNESEETDNKEVTASGDAAKDCVKEDIEGVEKAVERHGEIKDKCSDHAKVKAEVTSDDSQVEPSCDTKGEGKDESSTTTAEAQTEKPKDGSDKADVKEKKKWTVNKLKAEWRKFNIDLTPKLLYSGGDMVELLISSDIAKYCEFKTVTRILTVLNQQLEVVPCSRAGVFSSKTLSMLEKRMLMKLLQFCAEYENKQEELADFMDKPFVEFLASKKLSANVKHYIQHSIAMATDSTTTRQGLSHMRKFLKSLGRYGNTSFLWSLYGSGELPQSYCRMCAVFGGLYCLRMSASSLILDADNRCSGVITTEGQRIKCKWLIMENSYAPADYLSDGPQKQMSRAVIMTDGPLLPTGQHELSQMCLPCPDDGDRPAFIIELPPSSLSSPPGVYMFHLTRRGKAGCSLQEDLAYAVNLLFKLDEECEDSRPTVLWSLYFSQRDGSDVQPSDKLPSNVVLMSGPGMEIDIDRPVIEAKEVFQRILPEEEFLPKAPNPEDIVYIDDEETKVADGNTQSEFTDTDKQNDENQSDSKSEGKTDDQSGEKASEETGDKSEAHNEKTSGDQKNDENQSDSKSEGKTEDQSEEKRSDETVNQSDMKIAKISEDQSEKVKSEEVGDQSDDKSEDQSNVEMSGEEGSSHSVIKGEEKAEKSDVEVKQSD